MILALDNVAERDRHNSRRAPATSDGEDGNMCASETLKTQLDRNTGVLRLTMNRPHRLNAADRDLHLELSRIWHAIDADSDVRAVVVTGAERAFSSGGDLDMLRRNMETGSGVLRTGREALQIVEGMLSCEKPIVSAINGMAVGAGLAVALTADISVAGETVHLSDGHSKLGVAAGDHAVMSWPLLCGMAKAKRYLLLGEPLDGAEAERIGLVSFAVPNDAVLSTATRIAEELAGGNALALRWTKRSLNYWYRLGGPMYELSVFQEMLGFALGEAKEGADAIKEKRPPAFGSGGDNLTEWEGPPVPYLPPLS